MIALRHPEAHPQPSPARLGHDGIPRQDPEHQAVMFVYNTVWRDRRVLKEAHSLRRAGWEVTIIGLTLRSDPQPELETLPSGIVVHRIPLSLAPPSWRRTSAVRALTRRMRLERKALARRLSRTARRGTRQIRRLSGPHRLKRAGQWLARRRPLSGRSWLSRRPRIRLRLDAAPEALAGRIRSASGALGQIPVFTWLGLYSGLNWLVRGELDWYLSARQRWGEFAEHAARLAPRAAVYHGHDLSGVGAAIAARDWHGYGAVVYDSHELYVESGTLAKRSHGLKALLARIERRAYRRADAIITVNASIARELRQRYGERGTSLVYNCVPPRRDEGPPLLRDYLGLPPDEPIALYQGALTEVRGIRQMVAAVRLLKATAPVHLVFIGFGPMLTELTETARGDGRVHVIPPVAPDAVDAWVASADVCLMTNQPAGLNELLSTPNKLFESIAAGVPVVSSDFPERRAIVLDPDLGPLGTLCDPTDPQSIADAIESIVLRNPEERTEMRVRCRQAAARRWNWARQEASLLAVYDNVARAPSRHRAPVASRGAA